MWDHSDPLKKVGEAMKEKTESADIKRLGKNGVHMTCGPSQYPHIQTGGDNLYLNIQRNEEDDVVLDLNYIRSWTPRQNQLSNTPET